MTPELRDEIVGQTPFKEAVSAFTVVATMLLSFLVCVTLGNHMLADPDSFWHPHFGTQIIETWTLPTADAHSHSFNGTPWIAKEWLSQILFAAAHRLAGWTGIVLLSAAAASLAFTIVALHVLRRVPQTTAILILCVIAVLMTGHTNARPHLLAAPVMAGWFAMLISAAEKGRTPHPAAIILMALWANLHGSFIFGLGFGGLLAVEAVLRAAKPNQTFIGWALFGTASGVASLVHPYGFEHVIAAYKVMSLGPAKAVIAEWRPTVFSEITAMTLVIPALIILGLGAQRRLPYIRLALLMLLVLMALQHVRHMMVLGIVGGMLITPAFARLGTDAAESRPHQPALGLSVGLAAMLTFIVMLGAMRPTFHPSVSNMPAAAVDAALARNIPGNVINDYGFGGYLISRGVPTLIDGRTELFGPDFTVSTIRALSMQDLDKLDALLDHPQTGWTLLNARNPAAAYLDRKPGWRRLFADDIAVVHIRATVDKPQHN
jgi:hypothetical protein